MSDAKFTKGPWECETPLGEDCYSIVQAGLEAHEWRFIAHIPVVTPEEGEFPRWRPKANANVIVAAPDMYEALEIAEFGIQELCYGQHPENECWNTLKAIRAALAKARGEV